ncbi:MAG: PhzF family phenazine biosynthesis protein [candidate division KSB1 bacterium]|nr:PhzF family phenazine biosynthesis protein [candidate division KSB1 bacterium]MDZ7318863.1 PhzF family phenazine biosynthesis protein [candidate division KSB1 bacterium]MDZ7339748.1 PhzF family phenazine biosynthesis protein [candidate division KSB1 bacterium]
MPFPLYQIDAFTSQVFAGNPAAVVLLPYWLDDRTLQSIAMENNLSETAFLFRQADHYELRWFTPVAEVDLCGHATLASAYVVFQFLEPASRSVTFKTRSGLLAVQREDDLLAMDFPARRALPAPPVDYLLKGLGVTPDEVLVARDHLVVYPSEAIVRALKPDMALLAQLDSLGVIATAPGEEADFVSRFFAPKVGVPEDPVTGSAHCTLIPYWSERLGRKKLQAQQVSARGGELFCEDQGTRVKIAGRAALYLKGEIFI